MKTVLERFEEGDLKEYEKLYKEGHIDKAFLDRCRENERLRKNKKPILDKLSKADELYFDNFPSNILGIIIKIDGWKSDNVKTAMEFYDCYNKISGYLAEANEYKSYIIPITYTNFNKNKKWYKRYPREEAKKLLNNFKYYLRYKSVIFDEMYYIYKKIIFDLYKPILLKNVKSENME